MNQKSNYKIVTLKDLWDIFAQRLWIMILAAGICCGGLFAIDRLTFVPQSAFPAATGTASAAFSFRASG